MANLENYGNKILSVDFCFVHPIFRFWFLVTFGDEITKNLCLHFARQDGHDGKKRKENHATKVTKIPETKKKTKIWDERNISSNNRPNVVYEHCIDAHCEKSGSKQLTKLSINNTY